MRPTDANRNDVEKKQKELLRALNATSQSARKSWLFFISLMAYLFVAIASVTHTDLLLNIPIKLPVLQIEIALRSFFIVAPVLFILTHFGVLLHHAMLTRKAEVLNKLLRRDEHNAKRIHHLRDEISSYFFTQHEAGPEHGLLQQLLLGAMGFVTLTLLPLCLLVYFQIAYLPVHDAAATLYHRADIVFDIAVLLAIAVVHHDRPFRIREFVGKVFLGTAIIFTSVFIATVPAQEPGLEQSVERFMTSLWPAKIPFDPLKPECDLNKGQRCAFLPTAAIFEQAIDYVSGRRPWFSRNLVVTDKESLSTSRQGLPVEARVSLRGRDLRYATFDRSNFSRVDLTGADLTGASLKGTDLREAILNCAFRGPKMVVKHDVSGGIQIFPMEVNDCPIFLDADLSEAKLSEQAFVQTVFQGASLQRTNLRAFNLRNANLSGVDLSGADLRGADLSGAHMDGAILSNANAEGASFTNASLIGAALEGAFLDGAEFSNATLSGALLIRASMIAADFSGALMFGANLSAGQVWQTTPTAEKGFALAVLAGLAVTPPTARVLSRLREVVVLLSAANSHRGAEAAARLVSALKDIETEAWNEVEQSQVWRTLVANTKSDAAFAKMLGDYLGALACSGNFAFAGILRTHFTLRTGYYEEMFTPYEVAPPGMSHEDVKAIRRDPGFTDYADDSFRYFEHPDIIVSFSNRVRRSDCAGAAGVGIAVTLRTLEATLQEATKRNGGE
jgi:uncharacterized protein YjbI with pentapeptide repeats